MKNNTLAKEDRKKYLLLEPLPINVIDIKEFDNLRDVDRFLEKHFYNSVLPLIEFYIISENGEPEYYITEEPTFVFDNVSECMAYLSKNAICNKERTIDVHWNHTRLENKKELEKRQQLISNLSRYSTQQLLNAKRIGHYADDGCPLTSMIRLAILDTREHVLRSAERKKIRQMKAKLQKSR